MSDFIEQEIQSPFGELNIMVSENSDNPYADAIEELNESIRSAKVQESYLDKSNLVYGIEVSFYYGKAYKELKAPVATEKEALDIAINELLYDVATY